MGVGLGGRGKRRRNIGQNHGGAKDCGGVKTKNRETRWPRIRDESGATNEPQLPCSYVFNLQLLRFYCWFHLL